MGGLSSLKKSVKRAAKKVKRAVKDITGLSTVEDVLSPEINIPAPPEAKVMPIADETLSLTSRRKKRARNKGSRTGSMLSNQDTLG